MSGASTEVVHIAGNDITLSGRYLRQRCAWCDAVLIDLDLTRVAYVIVPGEPDPKPATWPIGVLVAVDGGVSWTVDEERLPDTFCGAAMFLEPSDFTR